MGITWPVVFQVPGELAFQVLLETQEAEVPGILEQPALGVCERGTG